MPVNAIPSFEGRSPVQIGKLVKQERAKLAYNQAMANLLEQSDKDYVNLMHYKKSVSKPSDKLAKVKSFAEGLKNFFEKGVMF